MAFVFLKLQTIKNYWIYFHFPQTQREKNIFIPLKQTGLPSSSALKFLEILYPLLRCNILTSDV